jgi:hypothetical protein
LKAENLETRPPNDRRSLAMATVLDAANAATSPSASEHEPVARLPNLVALLRRRAESATDGLTGRVPPVPENVAAESTEKFVTN